MINSMLNKEIKVDELLYQGIDTLVNPELFFNLIPWNDKDFGHEKINFTISFTHHLVAEKMLSIIHAKQNELDKVLISIGTIALARYYNVAIEQTDRIEIYVNGLKEKYSAKKMDEALKTIHTVFTFPHAMAKLKNLAKNNPNKYGIQLSNAIGFNQKPRKIRHKRPDIPKSILDQCKSLANLPLNDKMFKLKRDKTNYKGQMRISKILDHIIVKFRNKIRPKDTKSECYRGAYIVGLFILSKWIDTDKLTHLDEYYLNQFVFNLIDITSSCYSYPDSK